MEVGFLDGRNSCRGYSFMRIRLAVRGCSSSANLPEDAGGASEAGLRTLLPRAFAGSKGGSAVDVDPRELRPPALFPGL